MDLVDFVQNLRVGGYGRRGEQERARGHGGGERWRGQEHLCLKSSETRSVCAKGLYLKQPIERVMEKCFLSNARRPRRNTVYGGVTRIAQSAIGGDIGQVIAESGGLAWQDVTGKRFRNGT
jgi:hypothetical protein